MSKNYSITIRIISIITLAAFLATQAAPSYAQPEKMGTVPIFSKIDVLFQQVFEFFNRNTASFKDGAQRSWFDRFGTMNRNYGTTAQISGMPYNYMAAALPPLDKSSLLEGPYDSVSGNLREGRIVQTTTSTSSISTSDSGTAILSSIRDCIYSFMASVAFLKHSSSVSPCVAHPGKAGTVTEKPPSFSGSRIILNRLLVISKNLLSRINYTLANERSQAILSSEQACLFTTFSSHIRAQAAGEARGVGDKITEELGEPAAANANADKKSEIAAVLDMCVAELISPITPDERKENLAFNLMNVLRTTPDVAIMLGQDRLDQLFTFLTNPDIHDVLRLVLVHAINSALVFDSALKVNEQQIISIFNLLFEAGVLEDIARGLKSLVGIALSHNPELVPTVFDNLFNAMVRTSGDLKSDMIFTIYEALISNKQTVLDKGQIDYLLDLLVDMRDDLYHQMFLSMTIAVALSRKPHLECTQTQFDTLFDILLTTEAPGKVGGPLFFIIADALFDNPQIKFNQRQLGQIVNFGISLCTEDYLLGIFGYSLFLIFISRKQLKVRQQQINQLLKLLFNNAHKDEAMWLSDAIEEAFASNPRLKFSQQQIERFLFPSIGVSETTAKRYIPYIAIGRVVANDQKLLDCVVNKLVELGEETTKAREDEAALLSHVIDQAFARNQNLRFSQQQIDKLLFSNLGVSETTVRQHVLPTAIRRALSNDPELLDYVVNKFVELGEKATRASEVLIPVLNVHIQEVSEHVQKVGITFNRYTLIKLSKLPDSLLERVFNKIIEPAFFKAPELFDRQVMRAWSAHERKIPAVKYLKLYSQLRQRGKKPGFLAKRLSHGKMKVLIMHNIRDGQGDELIRNGTLIQALLDLNNPDLEIVVFSNRPYIYCMGEYRDEDGKTLFYSSHPNMQFYPIAEAARFQELTQDTFDVIIHHCSGPCYNREAENVFNTYLEKIKYEQKKGCVYIRTDKASGFFNYQELIVDGERLLVEGYSGENVYVSTFRLCAELGLPFRHGLHKGSFFVYSPNKMAEAMWQSMLKKNRDSRPVAIVNGFGGEYELKGFSRSREDIVKFRQVLTDIVSKGYFIVFILNPSQWGMLSVAEDIISGLDEQMRNNIIIAPAPSSADECTKEEKALRQEGILSGEYRPYLYKYFLNYADMVIAVEGGIMHFAYNLGKPFTVFSMPGSGSFSVWLSAGISAFQGTARVELINETISKLELVTDAAGRADAEDEAPAAGTASSAGRADAKGDVAGEAGGVGATIGLLIQDYVTQAEAHERLGDKDKAGQYWVLAANAIKEQAVKLGDGTDSKHRAAVLFSRAGKYYYLANRRFEAAECHKKSAQLNEWLYTESTKRVYMIHAAASWALASSNYYYAKEMLKAAECAKRAGDLNKELNKQAEAARSFRLAAYNYAQAENWFDAAICYFKASELYEILGNNVDAQQCRKAAQYYYANAASGTRDDGAGTKDDEVANSSTRAAGQADARGAIPARAASVGHILIKKWQEIEDSIAQDPEKRMQILTTAWNDPNLYIKWKVLVWLAKVDPKVLKPEEIEAVEQIVRPIETRSLQTPWARGHSGSHKFLFRIRNIYQYIQEVGKLGIFSDTNITNGSNNWMSAKDRYEYENKYYNPGYQSAVESAVKENRQINEWRVDRLSWSITRKNFTLPDEYIKAALLSLPFFNAFTSHGTKYIDRFMNMMLEGKIRESQFDAYGHSVPDREPHTGFFDSFGYFRGTEDNPIVYGTDSNDHLAYLIPDEEIKRTIIEGLDEAIDKEVIARDRYDEILSKLMTYEEYGLWYIENAERIHSQRSSLAISQRAIFVNGIDVHCVKDNVAFRTATKPETAEQPTPTEPQPVVEVLKNFLNNKKVYLYKVRETMPADPTTGISMAVDYNTRIVKGRGGFMDIILKIEVPPHLFSQLTAVKIAFLDTRTNMPLVEPEVFDPTDLVVFSDIPVNIPLDPVSYPSLLPIGYFKVLASAGADRADATAWAGGASTMPIAAIGNAKGGLGQTAAVTAMVVTMTAIQREQRAKAMEDALAEALQAQRILDDRALLQEVREMFEGSAHLCAVVTDASCEDREALANIIKVHWGFDEVCVAGSEEEADQKRAELQAAHSNVKVKIVEIINKGSDKGYGFTIDGSLPFETEPGIGMDDAIRIYLESV